MKKLTGLWPAEIFYYFKKFFFAFFVGKRGGGGCGVIFTSPIENRVKDRIIRDIRNLLEQEDDYYKPKRVSDFWNGNYIEHESNGDRNENLSLEEYLEKIRPYLKDIIIELQKSDTRKIQLTIAINFISPKDVDEESVIYTKSDNKEFMTYDNMDYIVDEIFKALSSRYQGNLETSMKGSDIVWESVLLLYYKCHRIIFRCGGSYIDSPD